MPASKSRRLRVFAVALVVAVVPAILYAVVLPAVEDRMNWGHTVRDTALQRQDQLIQRLAEWFVALWVFMLGASIGSFLNVVVYRMPRGISIARRGSYCPRCHAPIRLRHNVPILGWFLLAGRCRVCRLPISPRYPLVEVACAVMFMLLLIVQLGSGGRTLPIANPLHQTGLLWILTAPRLDLIATFTYHLVLLSGLLAVSLMAMDRMPIPRKWCIGIAAIGLLGGWLLNVQPVDLYAGAPAWQGWLIGPIGTAAGIAMALALWLFGEPIHQTSKHRAAPAEIDENNRIPVDAEPPEQVDTSISPEIVSNDDLSQPAGNQRELVAALPLVGVFLGWQSVLSVALIAGAINVLLGLGRNLFSLDRQAKLNFTAGSGFLRANRSLVPLLATFIHLTFWCVLDHWPLWPGTGSHWWVYPAAFALAIVAHWNSRRPTRLPSFRASS